MKIHVVQQGDNLWLLSQRYGVSINQITAANDLDNATVLVVGQALVIPATYRQYIVQPGDTLWSISQRYSIPLQAIMDANQITNPSLIKVGQVLTIPGVTHTVRQGETLWMIASRYGVTVEEILRANQLTNPALIYPGQVLVVPERAKPMTEVNAYLTRRDQSAVREIDQLGANFTYLSPFTYTFRADGTIIELNESGIIAAARARRVAPLLVLTNTYDAGKYSSDLTSAIFGSSGLQETLITNILTVIRKKGYTGINLDFEYIYPADRENYNLFLRRVVARLHPEGYSVSIALAPKIRADQPGLLYEAHDYPAHGEIVDFVVLMTYEWGWAGGRPLAIAPLNEVRKVLDYAVSAIPRNKILMGVPLYGRDWKIPFVQGTTATTVSPREAVRRAAKYGAAIQYNETYQSPFFRYTDEKGQQHEVWFEDARSMQAKYNTVKDYQLRGISYWVLGIPFQQNWFVLRDNFRIRKLL